MTERKRGEDPNARLLHHIQASIADLNYRQNPSELQNWNQENTIIEKRNPAVGIGLGQMTAFYPVHWRAFVWGALDAHRALRKDAHSHNQSLPRFTEDEVRNYQSRVKPIISRISRYAEDPAIEGGLILIAPQEREVFVGRLESEYPEIDEHLLGLLIKDDDEPVEDIEELKESIPAYQGFAYLFLMVRDLTKQREAVQNKRRNGIN